MFGIVVWAGKSRHRQRLGRIHRVELGRSYQRKMRLDERYEQAPRLVLSCGVVGEPFDRAVANVAVVRGVSRLARSRCLGEIGHSAALGSFGAANESQEIALSVHHMQRNDLLDESVVVALRAKMQLADRHRVMSRGLQAMRPASNRAVIRMRVVPARILSDICSGMQARTRRHANRTVGVRGREFGAACRQGVQMGRLDDFMAVAPGDIARVLVRQNKENVGGCAAHRILGSEVTKGPPTGWSARSGNSSRSCGWIASMRLSKAAILAAPSIADSVVV